MKTVLNVFGFPPPRLGGSESHAREISRQLGIHGWKSVLSFLSPPSEEVRKFLDLPNVIIEVLEGVHNTAWRPAVGLATLLRKHRPAILHLNYTGFLSVYPWLAKMYQVEKVFFTDQTSRPANFVAVPRPLRTRVITRFLNAPLTKVVCVSEYGRRCLTGLDVLPPSRFQTIYNSVDVNRADEGQKNGTLFRRRHSIPDGRRIVAQLSWMIPEKGIEDLIDSAKLLLAKDANVHFVLVGDGPCKNEFMRKAVDLGVANHATFAGMMHDPMGEGVYAATDVVCQLSRWEEAFGFTIAEAMASRRPVVATRVGGIPELVEDGKTGYLVERGDRTAVVSRLLELLNNPALRRQMGCGGRTVAETRFELRKNTGQLLKLYGVQ